MKPGTASRTWRLQAFAELEPAERRGMPLAARGRIRFRHEPARQVVELAQPPSRGIAHHRKVLAALEAAGAEPSRLVHHAVAAGDDHAVACYGAAAAAGAAQAESHREAASFARLALDDSPRLDRSAVRQHRRTLQEPGHGPAHSCPQCGAPARITDRVWLPSTAA